MSEENTAPASPLNANADPFSPENIGILHFVTLSRIYDVLMADLGERNPEVMNRIFEVHASGGLVGPPPDFSGVFLSAEE